MSEYRVDRDKWAEKTFVEHMGNISAEVGRAITAHRNGNKVREDRAIDRAIDLFSATVDVWIGTEYSYRLKEVLRARDEFLRLFFDGTFAEDADNIDRYFTYYAFLARNQHHEQQLQMKRVYANPGKD
ncbi:MAG: hypothetical protein FWB75_05245 [Oscillospiraceae bacterium]|nr:hypothetical protein [Oscillospiraceae bacterium]